jgi:hypothetical protein
MRRILQTVLACAIAAPAVAASDVTLYCGLSHFVRIGGTEQASAALVFHNADLKNAVTIKRLTFRNVFGAVVHDSGPAVGIAHPLNTDFAAALDVTVVPPGANYYLRTNHIWGNNPLPLAAGGNEGGQSMSVTVTVAKEGERRLFQLVVAPRIRERTFNGNSFVEGIEHSRSVSQCTRIDD